MKDSKLGKVVGWLLLICICMVIPTLVWYTQFNSDLPKLLYHNNFGDLHMDPHYFAIILYYVALALLIYNCMRQRRTILSAGIWSILISLGFAILPRLFSAKDVVLYECAYLVIMCFELHICNQEFFATAIAKKVTHSIDGTDERESVTVVKQNDKILPEWATNNTGTFMFLCFTGLLFVLEGVYAIYYLLDSLIGFSKKVPTILKDSVSAKDKLRAFMFIIFGIIVPIGSTSVLLENCIPIDNRVSEQMISIISIILLVGVTIMLLFMMKFVVKKGYVTTNVAIDLAVVIAFLTSGPDSNLLMIFMPLSQLFCSLCVILITLLDLNSAYNKNHA